MTEYYTSVVRYGNNILYRGYKDGKRVQYKTQDFDPVFFIQTQTSASGWTDIFGNPVEPVYPGTMRDCKEFIDTYSNVNNMKIYGNKNYVAQFIHNNFKNEVEWETPKILYWDIETLPTEVGYSEPHIADGQISAVTFVDNNCRVYTFTFKDYNQNTERLSNLNIAKYVFRNEVEMLRGVVEWLHRHDPDIFTGWNSNAFDMVYLLTRIGKILGEDVAQQVSPWKKILHRTFSDDKGNEVHEYDVYGVQQLDYMHLFKKFGLKFGPQESHTLDAIANLVLGRKKLDYSMYKNLKEMYDKDFQRYIEYNIIDTVLVYELEQNLGYINMCLTAAYSAKINYSEELATIAAWDSIIYGELFKRKIAVPIGKEAMHREYPGGYQKDPIVGYHKYVVTEDVAGEYPSVMIQCNVSPETLVGHVSGVTVLSESGYQLSPDFKHDLGPDRCLAASGHIYKTDKIGIIPELVLRFVNGRKVYKAEMKKLEKQIQKLKLELASNPERKQDLEALIEEATTKYNKFDSLQNVTKLRSNSVYGAMASEYFRYYDPRLAESITITGQIVIKESERIANEFIQKLLNDSKDRVVYMHTDSIHICMDDVVERFFKGKSEEDVVKLLVKIAVEKIEPLLSKTYVNLANHLNCPDNRISMKTEAVCTGTFYVAKAKYAQYVFYNEGVYYAEPKLKIVGLDAIRSSTPKIGREMMKEAYIEIFEHGEKALQKFVKEKKKWFSSLPIEQIAFPRGTNGIEKYSSTVDPGYVKGTPGHVKAAILYNRMISDLNMGTTYGKILSGDKIKFVYLKTPNPTGQDKIGFLEEFPPEFKLEKYIDRERQFYVAFEKPMEKITEIIGWQIEARNTLTAFFGGE